MTTSPCSYCLGLGYIVEPSVFDDPPLEVIDNLENTNEIDCPICFGVGYIEDTDTYGDLY